MSHAASRPIHIPSDPVRTIAVVGSAAAPPVAALPTGSLIASNPPGSRPSHFKVLGNHQLGFQVWLSRDGLTWLAFGRAYPTYIEMAAAFAASYPRPAVVLDSVLASAYDTAAAMRGPATVDLVVSAVNAPQRTDG